MIEECKKSSLLNNDFNSNYNHIYISDHGFALANQNNFVNELNLAVFTSARSNQDTLDFTNNYWGTNSLDLINDKILINFYKSVRPFGLWNKIRRKSGLGSGSFWRLG